jgi:hypothetical protein
MLQELFRVDSHSLPLKLGIILTALSGMVVIVLAVIVGFWIKRYYYRQYEKYVKLQAALSTHEEALHFACHGTCAVVWVFRCGGVCYSLLLVIEIRNPLHAITASTRFLVEFFAKKKDTLPDDLWRAVELNMLRAEHMTMKINIMLDAV